VGRERARCSGAGAAGASLLGHLGAAAVSQPQQRTCREEWLSSRRGADMTPPLSSLDTPADSPPPQLERCAEAAILDGFACFKGPAPGAQTYADGP